MDALLFLVRRLLLWRLLTEYSTEHVSKQSDSTLDLIRQEAARAMSIGLMTLYADNNERHRLIHNLLTSKSLVGKVWFGDYWMCGWSGIDPCP